MNETLEKSLPAVQTAPDDGNPPESVGELMRGHPGLVIGGGLAIGLLVGALLPRGTARKLARGAIATAAISGEASRAFAKQASAGVRNAAHEASSQFHTLEDSAGKGAKRLRSGAASAAGSATSAGLDMTRAALRLLANLRR